MGKKKPRSVILTEAREDGRLHQIKFTENRIYERILKMGRPKTGHISGKMVADISTWLKIAKGGRADLPCPKCGRPMEWLRDYRTDSLPNGTY